MKTAIDVPKIMLDMSSDDFDVPWFEPDTETVVLRVTELDVIKIHEFLVNVCFGELGGEVVDAQADASHIKIADAMKGIARWSEGFGCQ